MILLNGEVADSIDLLDRALHYGDGLFETMPMFDGNVPWLERHHRRLALGCERLGMDAPGLDELRADIEKIRVDGRAVVKLIYSRGSGGRGYAMPQHAEPKRLVFRYDWPEFPDAFRHEGVAVKRCDTVLGENPKLAGIKHLNRLEQVLARAECDRAGYTEGLLGNLRGEVVEGVAANVFFLLDDELVTPSIGNCGVSGIMRETVISIARDADRSVRERAVSWDEALQADAMFLTNSLIGIWPVKQIEGRKLAIPDLITSLQDELVSLRGFC